jgi:hypothetical protein
MDLEGQLPMGKRRYWLTDSTTGNMVVQSVAFSLLLHLEAPMLEFVGASATTAEILMIAEGGSHDCRSASLGGLERSTALEERSPRSKPNLPGLPLSRAQPTRAGPPKNLHLESVAIVLPIYSVELARTQNPFPKPCHRLTNQVN